MSDNINPTINWENLLYWDVPAWEEFEVIRENTEVIENT